MHDVVQFPLIPLAANRLPRGHALAAFKARLALTDWINELPESVYHLGPTDAEEVTTRMLLVYLDELQRVSQCAV